MLFGARTVHCGMFVALVACSSEGGSPTQSSMTSSGQSAPPPAQGSGTSMSSGTLPSSSGTTTNTEPVVDAASSGTTPATTPEASTEQDTATNDGPIVTVIPEGGGGSGDGGGFPPGLRYNDFTCSWVLGIHTTAEWFMAGFTTVVDGTRWQASGIEMAQFQWANAGYGGWNPAGAMNPCKVNSKTPDRIVFCGVDTGSTTVQAYLTEYAAAMNNIKTKFPSVKRVDIMTTAVGPGDMECIGANRSGSSFIRPVQNQAITQTVAMFPGFAFECPRWEVASCKDFGLCPHISAAANAALAMTMGQWFIAH